MKFLVLVLSLAIVSAKAATAETLFDRASDLFSRGQAPLLTDFAKGSAWLGRCIDRQQPDEIDAGFLATYPIADPVLGNELFLLPLQDPDRLRFEKKKNIGKFYDSVKRQALHLSLVTESRDALVFRNPLLQRVYQLRETKTTDGKRAYVLGLTCGGDNADRCEGQGSDEVLYYCYYYNLAYEEK